ncbi:hydrocephalus-inducing protein homolog [Agelaius phoeniceus]|uniref:hydrocephalus-inducing protein homolog n=1 Tax=Agelaius phoeniceus TaxID=39638 RepID=UPI004054A8BC
MSETRQKLSPAPPKRSVFEVSPRELVFQNIAAREVSEMVLSIMNKDKIARMVKVCMESSPYFQLACPSDVYHIVPPGASAPVRIRFSPDENKDYSHELTCITAKEKIVVPIRAIGPRAILDFPAQVDFSECPVKHSTQKTLLVRNVGNRTAHYQLSTQSPFSVVPTAGTLGAGDTMQVTVTFHPLTNGDHCSLLSCNTGEESIHTKLHGEAVDVDVALSTNSIEAGKTFITMAYQTTVFIDNRSNITAHFQWKALPSEEEENKEKRRQRPLLHPPSEARLEKFTEEKEVEKVQGFSEDHTALLRSRVQEKKAKVQDDPLLFSSDIFFIEPLRGMIAPGGTQTVQISFHTTVLGSFEKKFQFSVAGSPTPVILTIRGSVTGPNLHFDLPELDFGDISFGFPYTQRCRLTNCSMVPVTFKLRMSDDGTQPAVSSFDQIRKEGDPSWKEGIHFCVEPREFTMNPSQGTILPQGHQDIEVTLCSNTVMRFERRLLVDLEGIAKEVASVVIKARCLVPELHVYPQILLYHECHLKVPYERKLVIRNLSNLPGCYGLIPQQRKDDSPVLYSSPKPCGIVQPYGTAEIPVIIEVQTLGEHLTKALVGVFGDERNPRPSISAGVW